MDIKDKIRELLVYIKLLKIEENKSKMIKFNTDNKNEEYFINKMKEIEFFEYRQYNLLDIIDKLLLNVGFNIEDDIIVNDINYVLDSNNNEYDYIIDFSVNGDDIYKFIFRYNDIWDIKPKFIFVRDNEYYCYNVFINNIEDDYEIELKKIYYELDIDSNIYHREYSYMIANYIIKWGYYSLNLELCAPNDYVRNNNEYNYKLDNEDKLREYLMNLDFPVSIDKVYKEIQKEFLGDISKYPFIKIECMMFDHTLGEDVVSDKILISNGIWKIFGMTKGDKTVMLDSNGEWSYKLLDSNYAVKLSMKIEDDDVSYIIRGDSKEELDKYFDKYLRDDMINANREIEKTKKLVRKIFEGNDNDDR